MVNLNHKKRSSKLNESGVSLIALVITIIVVIILAAIAFNSSTSTISKANYSKFVANLSEVQDAVTTKGVTEKGLAAANGNQVTDAQAYNYIAKGGTTEADFLPNSQVPEYTMIAENANIGIELPVIKVNTKNETGVKVSYGVTKDGVVFVWPPYLYEEEYYVTATDTVTNEKAESTGEIDVKVGNATFVLKTDESGKLNNTAGTGNAGGNTENDAPLTEEEKSDLQNLEVGDYIAFPQDETKVATLNLTKLYDDVEGISNLYPTIKSEKMKWKILDIDEETGKILITTDGVATLTESESDYDTKIYLNGAMSYLNATSELNRICKELYSITHNGKNYEARSLNVEDLNLIEGYDVESENPNPERYAYYSSTAEDTPDVEINGKIYYGIQHSDYLSEGWTDARFYTWDDPITGEEKMSTGINDYRVPTETVPVLVTNRNYGHYLSNNTKYALGDGESWLASTCTDAGNICTIFDVYIVSSYGGSKVNARAGISYNVYGYEVHSSNTNVVNTSFGIRPVISIDSRDIDFSDTSRGDTTDTAWSLK